MTNAQGNRGWAAVMVAAILMMLAAAIAAPAQTFTTLVNFNLTNGALPIYMSLVQGRDGNLYGTTFYGGANGYYGTVFKMTPSGTLTTLYSFCNPEPSCPDGSNPTAGLVLGFDGNLYGTTHGGYDSGGNGYGTVFKITSGGKLTTLYSFSPNGSPYGPLVEALGGNFYGTTSEGGASFSGSVFKITSEGNLTTLYSFCAQTNCTDGAYPHAGLVVGIDANLYGTTAGGGTSSACLGGCGTVFKITPGGTLTTLHSFNSTDGAGPSAGLVRGSDGNFYGTTFGGGANNSCTFGGYIGCGTVFKITPSGTLTTLHNFDSTDGANPSASLIQATDGNFYGATPNGANPSCNGGFGCGTVFKITPGGTLTTLHSFNSTDGANPGNRLVQATNGTFYGATSNGGASGDGTIFSLSVGLGPFVQPQPTSGKAGTAVKILGTNLTGATSVTFNGSVAVFTVVASSLITTTVPTGATTGPVQVVTPSGTLTSNVNFRVFP